MTHVDNTDLDSLAAQARAFGPLSAAEVEALLTRVRARDDPASHRLVEHHLDAVFDVALAHRDQGIDVGDLYQEGTLAALVAISEYANRGGAAAGLRAFMSRVVSAHLEDAIQAEVIERETEAAFVRDTERYEAVEVQMRHELGRSPTPLELAAVLEWPQERVEVIGEILAEARGMHDSEILTYLDDA